MTVSDEAGAADRIAAIRYTVLRKLVPGFRHVLMGQLQALHWAMEAAARGTKAGVDPAKAQETMSNALRESAAAIKTSDSVMQWLRPGEEKSVNAREAIAQCVRLASEDWFLRGIEIRVDEFAGDFQVSQQAFQEVTVGALLAMADIQQQNADIHLSVAIVGDVLELALTGSPEERQASFPTSGDERRLTWKDIKLLADLNGTGCAFDARSAKFRFSRINASDRTN